MQLSVHVVVKGDQRGVLIGVELAQAMQTLLGLGE